MLSFDGFKYRYFGLIILYDNYNNPKWITEHFYLTNERKLIGTATQGQSGPGSYGKEGVL